MYVTNRDIPFMFFFSSRVKQKNEKNAALKPVGTYWDIWGFTPIYYLLLSDELTLFQVGGQIMATTYTLV